MLEASRSGYYYDNIIPSFNIPVINYELYSHLCHCDDQHNFLSAISLI